MMADPSTPSNLMTFWLLARPLNRTSFQVPVPAFCEPGACSMSCDIWRPLTGSSLISRSLTLTPIRAELMSIGLELRLDGHRFGDARPASSDRSSANSWAATSCSPVNSRGANGSPNVARIVYTEGGRFGDDVASLARWT